MPNIDKVKNIKLPSKPVKVKKKVAKTLTKSRSLRSKSDTLSYYHCLIDQVANPLNEKVKITKLTSHCRCKKGEVAAARQEHKQQLVRELAKNYLAFGENLGHYLHADIVGCAKELKK